jgi:hypothetical protein
MYETVTPGSHISRGRNSGYFFAAAFFIAEKNGKNRMELFKKQLAAMEIFCHFNKNTAFLQKAVDRREND